MTGQAGPGIRVMLVDRERLVLHGLQRVIDDEQPQLGVVATATCCAGAVDAAHRASPHVVVLDGKLASEDEAAVVGTLSNGLDTRVLLLVGSDSDRAHEDAMLRGACGIVRKEESAEVLIKAIKKVHEGELWLERSATGRLFVELFRRSNAGPAERMASKLNLLTCREQEVVRTLVTRPGADNKTLAATLHMGEHTLRNHLSRIYDKLRVTNRVELYVLARSSAADGGMLSTVR